MFRRNDLELAIIKMAYKAVNPNLSFHVFDLTVKLPPNENVSLSWYITPTEIKFLQNAAGRLTDIVSTIERCWRGDAGALKGESDCE
jgi:hypothetical protein